MPFDAVNAVDLDGQSYQLTIEVNYLIKQMTVTLDGQSSVFSNSAFDAINRNSGGSIGLITWGERVSYDNVIVQDFTIVSEPGTLSIMVTAFIGILISIRRRFAKLKR